MLPIKFMKGPKFCGHIIKSSFLPQIRLHSFADKYEAYNCGAAVSLL